MLIAITMKSVFLTIFGTLRASFTKNGCNFTKKTKTKQKQQLLCLNTFKTHCVNCFDIMK